MTVIEKRVLWVDDDGRDRFIYEELCLAEAGWTVVWAGDAREAVRALSNMTFHFLLLDQMLPYSRLSARGEETAGIWGGCLLLYWLRGHPAPPHAPAVTEFRSLYDFEPIRGNRGIPVIVVSGFQDDEVDSAMRQASPLDKELVLIPKPVDEGELMSIVESLRRS